MLDRIISGLDHHWHNLPEAILVLLITLVVTLVLHLLLHRQHAHTHVRARVWLGAAVGALSAPLQIVVWMIGLSIAVDAVTSGGRLPTLAQVFPQARDVVVVAAVAWFLVRVVDRVADNLYTRAANQGKGLDETATDAIKKLAAATIIAVAAMIAIQATGYSVASLLTFGGVAGIAVGFAARAIVANLLGGITIYASRPFSVGDHIIVPGTEIKGQVQHIGWRATKVLGWIGKPFYVPNALFNTETLINHSNLVYRQISETIYIRLEDIDKVAAIIGDGNAMLESHPEMQHPHKYFVFRFSSYGKYALELYLYAYAKSTAYADFMVGKEDILLKLSDIIAAHGARLAVPVSTVYAPEGLQLHAGMDPALTERSTGPADGARSGPDRAGA